MPQQQTLRRSISYSGLGLHSGARVNMTLLPAPPGAGRRFRRVDLEGRPEIEARVDNVSETNRSTSLARGGTKIHTVEHVLAALSGFEVDNAIIELDASEPPIADGSAREFCRLLLEAGLERQADKREPYKITEAIQLTVGETMMSVFPADTLKLTCTSADKGGRFTQFFSLEVTPERWHQELAHARTFCFFEEIVFLFKNGLIRGGSLENAIVIRDDAVLTNEPLRYPEEFVRHKMLDILGDLALVGRPLLGHIIAIRPSHAANVELARAIQAQIRKPLVAAQSFAPPPVPAEKPVSPPAIVPPPAANRIASTVEKLAMAVPVEAQVIQDGACLDVMQVMKMLPHRPPFLMVDKVTKIEGNHIIALKNVTIGEPYFAGHFPGHPIMPGVLQLEAIAQVAGILMLRQAENFGKLAYFMSAESVKWRKPVRPGDTLVIDVELLKSRGKIGKARGVCLVNGEPVSEAEVTFMLIDQSL